MTDDSKLPSTPLFTHKFLLLTDFRLPQNQDSCYSFANHEFDLTDSSIFQLNDEFDWVLEMRDMLHNIWSVDYRWWCCCWWEKRGAEEEGHMRERWPHMAGKYMSQRFFLFFYFFHKSNLLFHTSKFCVFFLWNQCSQSLLFTTKHNK